MAILLVVTTGVIVAVLAAGLKDDAKVVLRKGLVSLARSNARRFLRRSEAEEFILWLEADVAEMVASRGSGVGVAILFLVYVGPKATFLSRSKSIR